MHPYTSARTLAGRLCALAAACATALMLALAPAGAADPIKIGLSLSLTGATAPAGRQVQTGLEIWRDHVNAKGGLLGGRSSSSITTIRPTPPTRPASTPS